MKSTITLLLALYLSTPSSAYTSFSLHTYRRRTSCLKERPIEDEGEQQRDDDDSDSKSFAESLSRRIAQVEKDESSFLDGLQKRIKSVAKADEFDSAINNGSENIVELPVICLDALLPNQRLTGEQQSFAKRYQYEQLLDLQK